VLSNDLAKLLHKRAARYRRGGIPFRADGCLDFCGAGVFASLGKFERTL
jgi:hypothetical protein